MKKFGIALAFFALLFSSNLKSQNQDELLVDLARLFGKDIFETNGVLYMKPVVRIVNSTSNTGFFNSAFVPYQKDDFYVKVGFRTMTGLVGDDLKVFNPALPYEEYDQEKLFELSDISATDITKLLSGDVTTFDEFAQIADVPAMAHYIFLNMMYDGYIGEHAGAIKVPAEASTAMGNITTSFELPGDTLVMLFQNHPLYENPLIPQDVKDSIESYMHLFPPTFPLYAGNDMNYVFAAVPQIDIGSFYGTEMTLRFIPPLDYGEVIGEFAFWGVGLKHSISQYFYGERIKNTPQPEGVLAPGYYEKQMEELRKKHPFDLALQVAFQGTTLENEVGETNALLEADATMINGNIHASYYFDGLFEVYGGLSYDKISIDTRYTYYLPLELQWELGLLDKPNKEPTPGYPGDNKAQTTSLSLEEDNIKFSLGILKQFGDFNFFVDYSISKFNIFSAGASYRIN
jgi:hypothetical protein